MEVETKLISSVENLDIMNIAKEIIYSNTKEFENFNQASNYLNETLNCKDLNENEILISNKFQLFCSYLQQSEQLAKFTLSFITPKIQQFIQQSPHILSSLFLILIEISSKVFILIKIKNNIYIFRTNLFNYYFVNWQNV